MRKLYCDRCEKECRNVSMYTVPKEILKDGNYTTKAVELCDECYDFVQKVVIGYNEGMAKARLEFCKTLIPNAYKAEVDNGKID